MRREDGGSRRQRADGLLQDVRADGSGSAPSDPDSAGLWMCGRKNAGWHAAVRE